MLNSSPIEPGIT